MGTLSWVAEAWRVLLEWVDANKGTNGKLHQLRQNKNDSSLIVDFLSHCNDAIPEDQNTFDNTVQTKKIEWKLERVWEEYRLSKYKLKSAKDSIADFYNEGTAALDWELLGNRLEGVYTEAEIIKRKAKSHGRSKRRAEDEGDNESLSDDNRDPRRSPKRRQTDAGNDGHTGAASAPTLNAERTTQAAPSAPATSSSRDQAPAATTAQTGEPQHDSPLQNGASEAGGLLIAATLTPSQHNDLPKLNDIFQRVDILRRGVETFASQDTICQVMLEVQGDIRVAVHQYLDAVGVGKEQRILLEPEQFYPRGLVSLLETVLGGTSKPWVEAFETAQDAKVIGYDNFLCSIIAAAVTDWCFRIAPSQGDTYMQLDAVVVGTTLQSGK